MKKTNGIELNVSSGSIIRQMTLILLLFAGMILIGSCNKCKKDCGGCGVLDEENCECDYDVECLCRNGKQDGREEYIDCGADCEPCACKYDPCEFLTGGSKKAWKFAKTIESNNTGYEPVECDFNWTYTFQVNHVVESGCLSQGFKTYVWEMDDPEAPIGFFFIDGLGAQFRIEVHKLTADSLIIMERYGLNLYKAQ